MPDISETIIVQNTGKETGQV